MFGSTKPEKTGYKEYVKRWSGDMRHAYNLASKHNESTSAKGKKQHDKEASYSTLEAGDRVLVRNLTERGGPGKLRSHWEDIVHVVVNRKPDSPVYEIKPETGKGRHRVLHRNLLLPCDFLPLTPPQWRNRQAKKRRKTEHYNTRPVQEEDTSGSETGKLRRIHCEKDTGTQFQGKKKRRKSRRLSITIQMSNRKYQKRTITEPQVKTNRNPHHPATNRNPYHPTTILNPR